MIDKGPFENHPPGAGYHWSIRLFINIHHPIFGIPIPCRFYSHLRPYYFKPNVCTVNVFCCWPWHPHWMHFWGIANPSFHTLWFHASSLHFALILYPMFDLLFRCIRNLVRKLTDINIQKMYEDWVYPHIHPTCLISSYFMLVVVARLRPQKISTICSNPVER